MDEEETPELTWICPDCDYISQHGMSNHPGIAVGCPSDLVGGKDLPKVKDTETCIRSNCIRRYVQNLLIEQTELMEVNT